MFTKTESGIISVIDNKLKYQQANDVISEIYSVIYANELNKILQI